MQAMGYANRTDVPIPSPRRLRNEAKDVTA
jgi:hypothetical protein